jgi:hypothetical protein
MPVINGVYLKDFAALPSAVVDANIIPIAISGNQIAYRTTVGGIVTDARVTSKLLTGLSVTGGAVVATDTILQAFGKVQNQINSKVSSVGLTMPAAFSVANSPITSAGTLAVTAIGAASQYIRGDGALADFPTTGGGGSSVAYYLNGSVNQGTIGGNTYYEMNKTPVIGTGTDFTIAADGYIAQFITDANDPASLLIPAGNWNVEMYFSASSSGGTPSFYVEVYKYNGTTFTLLGSSATTPEGITNGTAIDIYYTSVGIPETVLTITDRLAIRVYVTHSGRTITLHTEDNHLSEIVTTFSNGLTALNGLTKQAQYFAVGSTGTDFNISSSVDTHTFNIPSASASARGLITTGTQSFAGDKTFNGTVSGVNVVLSSLTSASALQINRVSGNGILINDVGGGTNASVGINNSVGNSTGFQYIVGGTSQSGTGFEVNAVTSYSGIPFIYYKNGVELFKVDTTGNITANSFIKTGGTSSQFLKADGSVDTTTYQGAISLGAIGITPNANAASLVGSILNLQPADASFGGVVTTGTQTFAGAKTFSSDIVVNGVNIGRGVGNVSSNTAIGQLALNSNTIGQTNVGVGVYALFENTIGNNNTVIGYSTGRGITTGSNNTIIGSRVGDSTPLLSTLTNNIIIANGTGAIKAQHDGTNWTFTGGTTLTGALSGTSASFSGDLTIDTNTLYVDSTNNRVGIGTASPNAKLEVVGTAGLQTESNQQLRITAPTTTVAHGAGLRLNAASGAKEAVGIVGIVNEASGNYGSITFHTYAGGADIPERMRITSGGNVNILSTSTNSTFTDGNGGLAIKNSSGTPYISWHSDTGTRLGYFQMQASGIATISSNASGQALAIEVNGSERMRFLSGGAVCVNATAVSGQGEIFNATATNLAAMFKTTGGAANNWAANFWNNGTSGNNIFIEFGTETSYTGRGSITYNRGAGLTVYNTTSDYRLKSEIEDFNALDIINNLNPKEFRIGDAENKAIGFIAHELQEFYPQAVHGEKDEIDSKGNPKYQGVDYSQLTGLLVKGMQEQQAQIEELKLLIK